MARSAGIVVVGQPAAVDVAEQVVLGAGLVVDVGQVDTGVDGFYRHPTILPDRGRRTRAGYPHGHARRARRRRHARRRTASSPGSASARRCSACVSVAAVVLAVMHLDRSPQRRRRARVPDPRCCRPPPTGPSVLINMNTDTVDAEPADAARRHRRPAQRELRDRGRAVQPGGAEAAVPDRRARSTRWRSSRCTTPATGRRRRARRRRRSPSWPGVVAHRHRHRGRHVGQPERRAPSRRPCTGTLRLGRLRRRRQAADLAAGDRSDEEPSAGAGVRRARPARRDRRRWSTSASRWPGRCGGCRCARCCAC